MKYVVSANEMKTYDRRTIEEIGIPSMVLMERAALATMECILNCYPDTKHVLVVAGTGNNGGDGLAVGRLLFLRGIDVDIYIAGNKQKMSNDTMKQADILRNLGISFVNRLEPAPYDLIVDALLGIGLSREVEGDYKDIIEQMNAFRMEGAKICAIDIPSGICADDGQALGTAVYADITATFAFAKKGHLLYSGKEHSGRIFIHDIGIDEHAFHNTTPEAFILEPKDILTRLPKRNPAGNKGTFGKVLLIAGSYDMSGACILCGESILRTGAGMVKIMTPDCNREIIQNALPEAMLYSYHGLPSEYEMFNALGWADIIVAGPGMGTNEAAYHTLKLILEHAKAPLVLDADALNLLSEHDELMELATGFIDLIITPHTGELARLLQKDISACKKNMSKEIRNISLKLNCTVVGKDAVTLVCENNRKEVFINTSGNDGMATAGSGDVLAGIIGGLLAQGLTTFDAAYTGVFLHGLAGMSAAEKKGHYGMIASDIIEELQQVMNIDKSEE